MKQIRFLFMALMAAFLLFVPFVRRIMRQMTASWLKPSRSVLPDALVRVRLFVMEALRLKRCGTCAVALLALLFLCTPRAQAQYSGAYVNPRPFILYSGPLTNSQVIVNAFTITNLLNYSGFHRVGLWLTINPGTNNANRTSNLWVNVSASFGSGGGYTNSALGTNLVYSIPSVFNWTNQYSGSNTLVLFTNLDWPVADSVLYLQGTIGTSSTNNGMGTPAGTAIQVDGVLTP